MRFLRFTLFLGEMDVVVLLTKSTGKRQIVFDISVSVLGR